MTCSSFRSRCRAALIRQWCLPQHRISKPAGKKYYPSAPMFPLEQGWKIRWTSAGITYNTYYIVLSYNTQAYYVRGPPPLGNQMYPMLSQDISGYCSVYLRILRDMLVRGQDQMLSSVAFKVGRAVLCISAEGPAGIMYNTYYIILNIYYVFCIFHPC